MDVLVDTCIWSLALRRVTTQSPHVQILSNLISENRAYLIGPIRQEILSGINQKPQFIKLRNILEAFPDLLIQTNDYECAAEFSNTLRKKGIQGSAIDFLICAVAHRYKMNIYSVDKDFDHYIQHLPLKLFKI
jgi:predicted nucleic acid-binding protein